MASYKVVLKKLIEKDLRKIDRIKIPKILDAIEDLSEEPFPDGSRKLTGSTSVSTRKFFHPGKPTVNSRRKELQEEKPPVFPSY